MIVVKATIRIRRPIDDVFAYLADPAHLADWNSAVTDVQPTSAAGDNPSRFLITRQLPIGLATNELRIVASEPPTLFAIETTSGPTPFHYQYRFTEDDQATTVDLDARAAPGPLASLLGPLARRGLESGIRANLETLRNLLERHADQADRADAAIVSHPVHPPTGADTGTHGRLLCQAASLDAAAS